MILPSPKSPPVASASTYTAAEESIVCLRSLVDSRVGIVHSLHRAAVVPDAAPLVEWAAVLASSEPTTAAAGAPAVGAASIDSMRAEAAALGEAAERYSLAYCPVESLPLVSEGDLAPATVIGTEHWSLFLDEQYTVAGFSYERLTTATPIHWIEGASLVSGERVWLPAQLVFLQRAPLSEGEVAIGYATSSGAACGPSLAEAILSGLLEVIERDAIMATWYRRIALPVVDPEVDHLRRCRLLEIHYPGAEITILDGSMFSGIPTALAVVRCDQLERGAVAFTVGAASSTRWSTAIEKAVSDAFRTRSWLRNALTRRAAPASYTRIETFEDQGLSDSLCK